MVDLHFLYVSARGMEEVSAMAKQFDLRFAAHSQNPARSGVPARLARSGAERSVAGGGGVRAGDWFLRGTNNKDLFYPESGLNRKMRPGRKTAFCPNGEETFTYR